MRRVIMWNVVSLDGYFEGPSKWDLERIHAVWSEDLERFSLDQLASADTLLFGRVTYEGMASHWPSAEGPVADSMNSVQKVVFSRTLEKADWNNTRLVRGPAEEEVARLKAQPGKNILIFGSADLCSTLMRHDLIDEYRVGVSPIVLGQGTPLFKPGAVSKALRLVDAKTLDKGLVILSYRPEGAA